ncbi:MAG: hypothetical protein ACJAQT_003748 [Akkermansiaceae bacterium]|jgi:hypothetical protein
MKLNRSPICCSVASSLKPWNFLEDKDLQHENRVKGWTPSLAPVLNIVARDLFEDWTEAFQIDEITKLKNPDDALSHRFLMIES